MSDYSSNYSDSKNSKIYFGGSDVLIDFKPFLESLTYQKTANVKEESSFFNIQVTNEGLEKVTRKLSFNVVAVDVKEAISNHAKFQKLLRMLTPSDKNSGGKVKNVSRVYVYFANLISSFNINNNPPKSYSDITDRGLQFDTKGLDYSPEMDMGFFDHNGLIFAKAFKISMDLTLTDNTPVNTRKTSIASRTSDIPIINGPGSLYGFEVKYTFNDEE